MMGRHHQTIKINNPPFPPFGKGGNEGVKGLFSEQCL
jgi:hypothetical protein